MEQERDDHEQLLPGPRGATVGRSPLLPSQPNQSGTAPAQRGKLPLRIHAGVHQPGRGSAGGMALAMTSRQIGHFFFEPKGYDEANQATHEYKEEVKVGYNLKRKVVLMTIWALSPLPLYFDPTLFGLFEPHAGAAELITQVGQIWLIIGIGGLAYRTVQLFFVKDVQTGLVWMTKIITDPFHDIKLYYKAPLYLLRGEFFDTIAPQEGA